MAFSSIHVTPLRNTRRRCTSQHGTTQTPCSFLIWFISAALRFTSHHVTSPHTTPQRKETEK
ncbi:MAG: hypothetical protein GY943_30405 [Chloroflexi bacterium]|nr:hypothetical protein [Chloroflexota bacterium]